MKCEKCGKEFQTAEVEHTSKKIGQDMEIGHSTYSMSFECPNCGHDNSPNIYYQEVDET